MFEEQPRSVALRPCFLPREEFQRLLDALQSAGFQCVGPVVRDGAIVFRPLARAEELPAGIVQEQAPGSYRLHETGGRRLFSWANGPQALKPLLFAPREQLWAATRRDDGGIDFTLNVHAPPPTAVIGLRACDLAALALQDRHFLERPDPDPHYQARREGMLLVGVDCTHCAATCFCVSTGDGPALEDGFDIGLSELDEGFLVLVGSTKGRAVLRPLGLRPATLGQMERASEEVMETASAQSRTLASRHLQQELFGQLDHLRWQQVAERCLACGNCTAVCPTCFCYRCHAEVAWQGRESGHYREWDSCFTQGHGSVHGAVLRKDICSRYRQWVTHKLAGWHEQFGRSGCVGCGRCISWCPAGIDITREVAVICGEEGVD